MTHFTKTRDHFIKNDKANEPRDYDALFVYQCCVFGLNKKMHSVPLRRMFILRRDVRYWVSYLT